MDGHKNRLTQTYLLQKQDLMSAMVMEPGVLSEYYKDRKDRSLTAMVLAVAILLLQVPTIPGQSPSAANNKSEIEAAQPAEFSGIPRAAEIHLLTATEFESRLLPAPLEFSSLTDRGLAVAKNDTKRVPGSKPDSGNDTDSLAGILVPEPAAGGAFRAGPNEAVHSKRPWSILMLAQHSAATFDAWSTRRAVSRGQVERNPFMSPFAHTSAIYGAIQVGPGLLDFLGYRMRRSQNRWAQRLWWVPQTAGTAASLFAGAHNLAKIRH